MYVKCPCARLAVWEYDSGGTELCQAFGGAFRERAMYYNGTWTRGDMQWREKMDEKPQSVSGFAGDGLWLA